MTLFFKIIKNARASHGFSLLEMLVVLALLASISALGLRAFRPPSPIMRLNAAFAKLTLAASTTRSHAITSGAPQTLAFAHETVELSNCKDGPVPPVVFFKDGTTRSVEICMILDGETMQLHIDNLTGRVVRP
ncbi:MAG: prepilin-type N-terminal cleavage/methylation domain-containing protein [Paracoccaceae bacterium]